MILRRLGNKSAIAEKIIPYFPDHKIYIEPFFGAGGMFFNKPKAKYNIVNDLDSDVFNLFMCLMNQKEDLEKAFYLMPIHSGLLDYWKINEELDPIKKAIRFLFLSNLTWMGKMGTLDLGTKSKRQTSEYFDATFKYMDEVKFCCFTFDKFINSIQFIQSESENCFIYSDPPYIGTDDNYSNSFTENNSIELFNTLQKTGCKWAMSEFDNTFILQQAKERNLNVYIIGERQNLKNRRTEILITNYRKEATLFD